MGGLLEKEYTEAASGRGWSEEESGERRDIECPLMMTRGCGGKGVAQLMTVGMFCFLTASDDLSGCR